MVVQDASSVEAEVLMNGVVDVDDAALAACRRTALKAQMAAVGMVRRHKAVAVA